MTQEEIDNITALLDAVKGMIKDENEKKQQTAEDFNIFEILGVAHLEVSTHSAFIANLLNPKGSHSQGAKFLEKFLKLIDVDVEGFNLSSAQVEVEKHIGKKRRIDIFITDNKNWAIAIENKIYAGLGEKQLGRYMSFLNKKYEKLKKKLVYLTLQKSNKKKDDDKIYENQGVEKKDFVNCKHISYETEITKWLNPFLHFNAFLPMNLAFGIFQYIYIINRLIRKDKEMAEWDNIINSKKAYEAYKKIISLDYRKHKIKTLLDGITEGMGNNLKWDYTKNFSNVRSESGMEAYLSENPEAKLCVIFEETNYKKLFIGIYSRELKDDVKKKLYDNLFEKDKEWESRDPWVAWKYWKEINSDVIETLCFDSNAEENKKNLIEDLKKLETAWMEINKPSES